MEFDVGQRSCAGISLDRNIITKAPFPKQSELEIGKEYDVISKRKGKFRILLTNIYTEFVDGVITEGQANAILPYNRRGKGEAVSLRTELTTFTKIEEAEKNNNELFNL